MIGLRYTVNVWSHLLGEGFLYSVQCSNKLSYKVGLHSLWLFFSCSFHTKVSEKTYLSWVQLLSKLRQALFRFTLYSKLQIQINPKCFHSKNIRCDQFFPNQVPCLNVSLSTLLYMKSKVISEGQKIEHGQTKPLWMTCSLNWKFNLNSSSPLLESNFPGPIILTFKTLEERLTLFIFCYIICLDSKSVTHI